MNYDWLINEREIIRYLGYGDQEPDEIMMREIKECESNFIKVVQPRTTYQIFDLIRVDERLFTADMEFELIGNSIKKHLEDCNQVAFSCLTLSEGVDELIESAQKKDMLHALIYDAIANACVEEVRGHLERRIQKEHPKVNINWLFGIGYGDLPLTLQKKFLMKVNAQTIGLSANDQYVLIPLKSVTGFIGISNGSFQDSCQQRSCHTCNLKSSCNYHKR